MTMNVPVLPSADDGSSGLPGDRTRRTPARWSANTGWVDRDGLPLAPEMLVIGHEIVLRSWQNKRPEYITEHPLPNVDDLNAAIPIDQWELGLDGKTQQALEGHLRDLLGRSQDRCYVHVRARHLRRDAML